MQRAIRCLRHATFFLIVIALSTLVGLSDARAAPYAAMVIDARTGEVLHSRNADTPLHPASLTKMMTLYIAFEAVENGEISLDTMVRISKKAAAEPPSRLGLKAGQRIRLRYLIRAAAVKSANDAATAIAEAIGGTEADFARRMNRTAKALGMSRSNFKNAHGLTEVGHMSTARDMTTLGRHLLYDYPEYYNLFSRRTTDAGVRNVSNTNSRLLTSYRGADGIKTGYTRAAGFNLVASAERGQERIIATVFGGQSVATRNARVAELLDLGFQRAPTRVALRKPKKPAYGGGSDAGAVAVASTGLTASPRPRARPAAEPPAVLLTALTESVASAVEEVQVALAASAAIEDAQGALAANAATAGPQPGATANAAPAASPRPRPRPSAATSAAVTETVPAQADAAPAQADAALEVITRLSSSGGRHWGINLGHYGSRYQAERVLLKTALQELGTLDDALRKVVESPRGYEANFLGLTEEQAALACRRLESHGTDCATFGPG